MTVSRRTFNRYSLLAAGAALAPNSFAAAATARNDIADLYDNADAMALARKAIEKGLPDGAFTGVPFLLKDLGVTWQGTVTTHGSRLHKDHVARATSLLVQRYERAGLVIFGKTLTPEYGLALTTENLFLGDCLNPWNTRHSTGGSSGGSAAAVAAGVLPMAHSTDGGGSIRVPANHCGVFGFKPTRGMTPGASGAGMSVGHVVSRSVRDSAAMLDVTAGYEAGAPYVGRSMGTFLTDYDMILQTVTATPAPLLGAITYREGDDLDTYTQRFKKVSAFTHLYNLSGQPSMSLPLGMSKDGLPIGVMLSGRVGEDARLFSLAGQVERAAPWSARKPKIDSRA